MITAHVLVAVLSCSRTATENIKGFTVLPADEAAAPRTTWIWVKDTGEGASLTAPAGTVPVTQTKVTVQGERPTTLLVLKPNALLEAGTRYTVTVGKTISQFTVDATEDTTPPAAPALALGTVSGGYFGAYSCSRPSSVAIDLTPAAQIAVLVDPGTTALPENAYAAGTGAKLDVLSLPDGSRDVAVLAFDLSGNSATSNTVTVDVPTQASGCSAAPAAPLLLALAALLSRRARGGPAAPSPRRAACGRG